LRTSPLSLVRALAGIVGRRNISAAVSETPLGSLAGRGGTSAFPVIARPGCTAEIAGILRYANRDGIPVQPTCGKEKYVGDVPYSDPAIRIDLCRLDQIDAIDEYGRCVIALPAVRVGALQKHLVEHELFLPLSPAVDESACLGGLIACLGPRSGRTFYGGLREYVASLEVVLADGEVIHTDNSPLASARGYDLTPWFAGARGTLGIISQVHLRVLPLPEASVSLAASFATLGAALAAAEETTARGVLPVALEVLDGASVRAAAAFRGEPTANVFEGMLLVRIDGEEEAVRAQSAAVARICAETKASNTWTDDAGDERIWSIRRSLPEALHASAPGHLHEEVRLSPGRAAEFIGMIHRLRAALGLDVAVYGSPLEGMFHVHIAFADETGARSRAMSGMMAVAQACVELNGLRHVVELPERHPPSWLSVFTPPRELELMRQLKRFLDPRGILCPGVVFPEERRV